MEPRARVAVQLERLFRSYKIASAQYDLVSLLDLIHTLRSWVEISENKEALKIVSGFNKFSSAKPKKKVSRAVSTPGKQYVLLIMANFLTCSVLKPEAYLSDFLRSFLGDKSISSNSTVKIYDKKGTCGVRGAYFGDSVDGVNCLGIDIRRRLTISQFFSSQILVYDLSGIKYAFDIRYLIKRMANSITDASHFQDLSKDPQYGDLAGAIPVIATAKVGGIDMIYFVSLYVAQEILVAFGKLERP